MPTLSVAVSLLIAGNPLRFSEIARNLGVQPSPSLAKILRNLKKAGVVEKTTCGRWRVVKYYTKDGGSL